MLKQKFVFTVAAACVAFVGSAAQAVTFTEHSGANQNINAFVSGVEGSGPIDQGIRLAALLGIEADQGLSVGTLAFDSFDWVSYFHKSSSEFLNPPSEFLTGTGGSYTLSRGDSGSYSHTFDPAFNQPPDLITDAYLIVDLKATRENDEGEIEFEEDLLLAFDLDDHITFADNLFFDLGGDLGSLTINGSLDSLDVTLSNVNDGGLRLFDKLKFNSSVFAYNYEQGVDPGEQLAVPEPASASLVALGALGLLGATRRRRRQA